MVNEFIRQKALEGIGSKSVFQFLNFSKNKLLLHQYTNIPIHQLTINNGHIELRRDVKEILDRLELT